ncbi:hypothetical protein QTP88_028998 [Uroleucon formosanum]
MTGRLSGVATRIKKVAPLCKTIHCTIHRQALASKNMPKSLKLVLDSAVKIVNLIKARPLNSRLFTVLCNEMGSTHKSLLLHTEVRWLSRGKVLTRLFELRSEILLLLTDIDEEKSKLFCDDQWLSRLAYMADIFDRLNILNLSLQGSNTNMFYASDKVNAFVKKLDLFISQVSKNDLSAFETLNTFWKNNEIQPNSNIITDISEHLQLLKSNILQYFPEDNSEMKWIINPFEDDYIKNIPEGILAKELFIDLTSDSTLKTAFKTKNITNFWLDVKQEYSALSTQALQFLIPFVSTYLFYNSGLNDLENGNINIILKKTLDSVDLDVTDIAENSVDTGNFLQMVYLLAEFDPIMSKLLNDEKNKNKYLSWKIQNELIDILASKYRAKNYEQLITNIILELWLDINMCRGQGYDGAAVMKGFYSGLQKRIKDKVPTASYIHCCAHNLNLVISDAVRSNQKVQFFFDTVQAVFNFFSSSAPRWATLAFGEGNASKIKQTVLKKVCSTRWESRHLSVYALKVRFIDVLKSLSNISLTSLKREEKNIASTLKKKLENIEFVLLLCLWENILRPLYGVSHSLQRKNTNLHNACQHLYEANCIIQNLRNEYDDLILTSHNMCDKWGISKDYHEVRSKFAIRHFDEVDGDRRINVTTENFKIRVFLPVIDTVIFQLSNRFNAFKEITENFDFLQLIILVNLSEDDLIKASYDFDQLYKNDITSDLTRQLLSMRELINISEVKNIEQLTLYILKHDYSTSYCDILSATLIYLTLPITVASAERSFSKLKLIKIYLRNSMNQDRLSNIAILNIEKNKTQNLDINKIIDNFANIKVRKVKFS